MKTSVLCLVPLLLCTGCGKREPAGPTAEQTAQLNEMENALDTYLVLLADHGFFRTPT